ncbi:MAG: ATP synthase F1 subunit delta [Patescibacteria group bacterium]|nr:MAG: ATP synthase F1 subunit delta [Patescibacteria group bacterium]
MATTATTYGQSLYRLTAGLPEKEVKRAVARFVELLAARHELELAPGVINAFEQEARKAEGIREISVASAEELSNSHKERLEKTFAKALGAKVEMRWKTEPDLIGGAVIRFDDILLDASLKGRLDRLKQQLI